MPDLQIAEEEEEEALKIVEIIKEINTFLLNIKNDVVFQNELNKPMVLLAFNFWQGLNFDPEKNIEIKTCSGVIYIYPFIKKFENICNKLSIKTPLSHIIEKKTELSKDMLLDIFGQQFIDKYLSPNTIETNRENVHSIEDTTCTENLKNNPENVKENMTEVLDIKKKTQSKIPKATRTVSFTSSTNNAVLTTAATIPTATASNAYALFTSSNGGKSESNTTPATTSINTSINTAINTAVSTRNNTDNNTSVNSISPPPPQIPIHPTHPPHSTINSPNTSTTTTLRGTINTNGTTTWGHVPSKDLLSGSDLLSEFSHLNTINNGNCHGNEINADKDGLNGDNSTDSKKDNKIDSNSGHDSNDAVHVKNENNDEKIKNDMNNNIINNINNDDNYDKNNDDNDKNNATNGSLKNCSHIVDENTKILNTSTIGNTNKNNYLCMNLFFSLFFRLICISICTLICTTYLLINYDTTNVATHLPYVDKNNASNVVMGRFKMFEIECEKVLKRDEWVVLRRRGDVSVSLLNNKNDNSNKNEIKNGIKNDVRNEIKTEIKTEIINKNKNTDDLFNEIFKIGNNIINTVNYYIPYYILKSFDFPQYMNNMYNMYKVNYKNNKKKSDNIDNNIGKSVGSNIMNNKNNNINIDNSKYIRISSIINTKPEILLKYFQNKNNENSVHIYNQMFESSKIVVTPIYSYFYPSYGILIIKKVNLYIHF